MDCAELASRLRMQILTFCSIRLWKRNIVSLYVPKANYFVVELLHRSLLVRLESELENARSITLGLVSGKLKIEDIAVTVPIISTNTIFKSNQVQRPRKVQIHSEDTAYSIPQSA